MTENNPPIDDRIQDPAVPAPPVQVGSSLVRAQAITLVSQLVVALGLIVTTFGLGEANWLNKLYRFMAHDEIKTALALIATVGVMVITSLRARRRQSVMSFFAAILPNPIATTKGPLHPAVQEAVEQVTVAGRVDTRVTKGETDA